MPLIGRIAAATARGYGLFANVVQAAVDPYFNYVVALLHGDGTNGGQNNTFLDSSTNNFTITRNGNTTQGAFSPFSQTGWGNYFDGSGDYLSVADNAALDIPGDFTIEFWVNVDSGNTDRAGIIGHRDQSTFTDGTDWVIRVETSAGKIGFGYGSSGVYYDMGSYVVGEWAHYAITRSGTTIRTFKNGTQVATATSSSTWSSTAEFLIGRNISGFDYKGFLSNVRLVKGTAVYTSNFTPSTTPLTSISGTSLLTCQSNRFIDNSSNAFAITRNGDVSVQPFSPFNPTTPYSTSSIGGSGYFDGSGDFLSVANSALLNLASTFSLEFWIYRTASNNQIFVSRGGGAANWSLTDGLQYGCFIESSTFYFQFNSGGSPVSLFATATLPTLNAWSHVAIARNGTTMRGWLNGVSLGTSTSTPSIPTTTNLTYLGNGVQTTLPFTGYMAGVRFIQGSAAYDASSSTITVPTAPVEAVANTSLLTNFTNGAIFDNAAVADYETVGNAQISTSVKKYGTGSMAFDGTGDYLTTPYSQSINFGTGDFTIEGWFYLNSFANQYYVLGGTWTTGTTDEWLIQIENNGSLRFLTTANTSFFATGLIKTGTWYHFAASRSAGVIKAYINGSVFATITNANSIGSVSKTLNIGQQPGGSWPWNGYLDDWRVTKGIGRYPYNFTPPTAEFPNIGGTVTLTADPYFDYTTLLLPGNGTNGAQNNTFLDSSTNNFTITRNGNTTQGTFSPFSQTGWGNYFDGTGDFLQVADAAPMELGSGNWTIEMWVNTTNNTAYSALFGRDDGAVTAGSYVILLNGATANGIVSFYSADVNSFTAAVLSSGSVSCRDGAWHHIAIVRNSNTLTMYIDGTSTSTATFSGSFANTAQPIKIGSETGYSRDYTGYISNVRLVVGAAVYTANFTPPTTPLTAITNTSLLTCQSNRFIDNSTNAFAITRNGDVSVQAFSPFNPTAAWSASTNGGSGYFDGSGDYLTAPDNAAFDLGAGAFTLECFAYLNARAGAYDTLIAQWNNSSDSWLFLLSGNTIQFYGNGALAKSESVTITTGQWYHFACTRDSSNNLRLYANGVKLGSDTAYSTTLINSTASPSIGCRGDGLSTTNFNGYLSSVRVIKGSAEYTGSTYTVPTAPLTAITNTSLLLSTTNAGIYDATSKNDLETVGNAQISTTQSKFGGSSMLFDGNGDDLKIITNPPLSFSGFAGDFTIEAWVYPTATGQSNGSYVCAQTTSGSYAPIVILQSSGTYNFVIYMSSTGSSWNLASAVSCGTATANAWNHIAVTRYGTNVYCFMNGILQSTTAVSTTALMTTSANWHIGSADLVVNSYLTGYIDDFRITRGIARYTSNFTPPTTAFLTL